MSTLYNFFHYNHLLKFVFFSFFYTENVTSSKYPLKNVNFPPPRYLIANNGRPIQQF